MGAILTLIAIPGIAFGATLIVPQGGTGFSSCTDGGVVVGSGTGALTCLNTGTSGYILSSTGSGDPSWVSTAGLGFGSVSSVGMTVPTGFTISGSPITTTGTLGLLMDTGYFVPTTTRATTWDTAYLWGNHASAGYLTSSSIDTSSEIATIVGDETGTAGSLVFSVSPALTGVYSFNVGSGAGLTLSGSSTLGYASSTALTVSGNAWLNLASSTAITSTRGYFTNATSSTSFQTPLLGVGTDYISDITGTGILNTAGSLNASLGTDIVAGEMANSDHGFFTYASNVASVDSGAWSSSNMASYLTDETGTAGSVVFSVSPTFTGVLTANVVSATGLRATASSTLGYASSTSETVANNAWLTYASSTAQTISGNAWLTYGSSTAFTATDLYSTRATSTTSFFSALGTFTNTVINTLLTAVNATITGVLTIPNGTAPTADDPGELAFDTTDNMLVIDDFAIPTKTTLFAWSHGSTSPKFATSTTWYLPTIEDGYVVTDINCKVTGGTSKGLTIFGETLTCDADGAVDDGAITTATIGEGSTTVAYTLGNTSGVVNDIIITVSGRITRE